MTTTTKSSDQKKRIYCTVTADEHAKLTAIAEEHGVTVSQMLVSVALAHAEGSEEAIVETQEDPEVLQYNSGIAPAYLHELNRILILLTSRPVLLWKWVGMHELRIYVNNLYCDAAQFGTRLDEVMRIVEHAAEINLYKKPTDRDGFFIRENLVSFCTRYGVVVPNRDQAPKH